MKWWMVRRLLISLKTFWSIKSTSDFQSTNVITDMLCKVMLNDIKQAAADMHCGQKGSRNTCLSLMGAPAEFHLRRILNKLVNFKAANGLLPHIRHFFWNHRSSCLCTQWWQECCHIDGSQYKRNCAMQSVINTTAAFGGTGVQQVQCLPRSPSWFRVLAR